MLQNASCIFFLKKQNKTIAKKRKKSLPAEVEPKTFDVQGPSRIIHCATQPLRTVGKLIVFMRESTRELSNFNFQWTETL